MALALHTIAAELGLHTILAAPRDLYLIFLTRFLRMAAYGAVSLVMALFLVALGVPDTRIGLFTTCTLLGDVALSLLLTLVADAVGRRRVLLLGCACMALAGLVFATAGTYWLLLAAAVLGVVSVSGHEIGPFRAVEESVLAGLVDQQRRSDVFAWYVVLGTLGGALGLAGTGCLVESLTGRGWTELDTYRVVFGLYGAVGAVKGAVTALLSVQCEVDGQRAGYAPLPGQEVVDSDATAQDDVHGMDRLPARPTKKPAPRPKMGFASLSSKTRGTLLRLCALFAIDSLASGMVPYSLVNFYLDRKFHMRKNTLGEIMSVVWIMASVGNIFASALSKRIGLVKTMVFTHLPSAIFLAMLPAASTVWLTVVLLVGRGTLASMDQAPRSAFLSKVVAADERTAVMGIVNVVKTLSQSGGPSITGILAGDQRFWVAFVVAGALKASYDLGFLTFFLKVERQAGTERPVEQAGLAGEDRHDGEIREVVELESEDEDPDERPET